ncbi:MAG: pantoate--beta-alanine ligase [Phycisphaerae bacterium]
MNVCKTIQQIRNAAASARREDSSVLLVPTMGALHEGHFSLIRQAVGDGGFVVVSIFVNPTQFAPGEDLASYPRCVEQDLAACESLAADAVFLPQVEQMYPQQSLTQVSVAGMTETLCGRSRQGHFTGVCTVVAKLLNIVQPDVALFGQKDFQQAAVIRRMVADLNFPVQIRTCPTVREQDGLAMSSRNAYLGPVQRQQAPVLYRALQQAGETIRREHPPAAQVVEQICRQIEQDAPAGRIDYVEAVDPVSLLPVEQTTGPVLLALAVHFGRARLIDNLLVDSGPAKP